MKGAVIDFCKKSITAFALSCFFRAMGMTDDEIAAALEVTDRTVRREWVKARARLKRALYG